MGKFAFTIEELFNILGAVANNLTLGTSIDPFELPLSLPTVVEEADFHYYTYDHLGNTRIVYSTTITNCSTPEYTLEAVMDYFPYGKILRQFIKTPEKYVTTGHERDVETGLDYRGARFYDSDVARFLSLDPLAAEFPAWSDYNYVLGNPVMLVDPDGKAPEDVIIEGGEKQKAFNQLQSSVKNELSLSMGKNGKVEYKKLTNKKLSKDANQLVNAIDDHSVLNVIHAENTKMTQSGDLYIGGAFSGNTVISKDVLNAISLALTGTTPYTKNMVITTQEVNPSVLGKASTAHGKPGANMLHEVTESYQGALISQKSGVSSPAANKKGSVYSTADKKATNQSGNIYERIYDASGNEMMMMSDGSYPKGVKSADWYVKNKGGKKVVIQKLK